jgi:hypothetical protein
MALKISSFQADNFKRLKHVSLTPDPTMQVITGRNAQGKTSVVDAWVMALSYATGKKVSFKPVRDGEEQATVQLELSEGDVVKYHLHHTFKADGKHDLKLSSPEGARYSSPDKLLKDFVGALSFEPLAFATKMDEKERLATLLGVVDLGDFSVEANAGKRLTAYEARREVNRKVSELDGQIKGMQVPPADLPLAEISSTDVLAQLRAAQESNGRRRELERHLADANATVERLRAELVAAIDRQGELAGELSVLAPFVDESQFSEQLAGLEQTNARIREGIARADAVRRRDELQAEADHHTGEIARLDAAKAVTLAAAKMPLPGLGFDENGVTYLGQPFSQASGAEKLRVSIAIGMALNPDLRVMRVDEAGVLDADNLAMIEQLAADNDFQIWITKVDHSGVAVVIEDGEVFA